MAQDESKAADGEGVGQKPEQGAGPEPEEKAGPDPAEGQGGEEEVVDTHGQPGINRERHEKEMAAKDAEIAELQAQLDEKAETEKGRAEIKAELDKIKAELADERVAHKLELAGCRNVKAAKALLGDYGGDVAKLKEECPYLFDGRKAGSTGLKPDGDAGKALDAKLDKAFGIKE